MWPQNSVLFCFRGIFLSTGTCHASHVPWNILQKTLLQRVSHGRCPRVTVCSRQFSCEGKGGILCSSASNPGKRLPSNTRQPSWRAVTSYLPTTIEHFFILSFRKKGWEKINTFPFSELMSNDQETLPLGAQAIEQSSISSSSTDSLISAAAREGGQGPTRANHKYHHLH